MLGRGLRYPRFTCLAVVVLPFGSALLHAAGCGVE